MGVSTSLAATATTFLLSNTGPTPPVTFFVNGNGTQDYLNSVNVTFYANQQQLGTVPGQITINPLPTFPDTTYTSFTANYTTTFVAPTAEVVAVSTYLFNNGEAGAVSNTLPFLVQANTAVTLNNLTPNPATVQGTVTIGASLVALYAGAQNALSGQTIAFYSGGTLLGTGLTDASGNALFVTTFSQAGPYTITAQFLGSPDGVYLSSTSGPVTLQVTPSPVSSTPTATSAPPTTTAAPPTTMVMSSTTTPGSTTTPDSVPVLKVFADPPAAQFPGCGKRTNLTATVSDATISGSITFDLAGPRLKDVPSGKYSSRQLGVAALSGGTATLMTSLFPAFPPGEYSIRTTYTGPSTLNGVSTQVTYPVSKLCF